MHQNKDRVFQIFYKPPTVEVIDIVMDSPVLSASTEQFNSQQDYDGEWA